MHWQYNGTSCGKRQLLRNDRGRYLPRAFHERSKKKGKSPRGNGEGTKKKITTFLDVCVSYSSQPLLERFQAPVIAQISCNSAISNAVFIAGEACFWGSHEMAPGGLFPLNLWMAQIWQSSLVQHRSVGAIPGSLQPQGPSRIGALMPIAPGAEGRRRRRKKSSGKVGCGERRTLWQLSPQVPFRARLRRVCLWGCSWDQHQARHSG